MNKIIRGRRYDTETATSLHSVEHGQYGSFDYWTESLYCKRTGEYFLYGYGGPLTKYAVREGNDICEGEVIEVLSVEQAQEWAEKNMSADEYESIFGQVDEGVGKKAYTMSLEESLHKKLLEYAVKQGKTKSEVIAEWIRSL